MPAELKVVIPGADIRARIAELAADISDRFGDEPVVAVCVLKGAFMFFSDLVRALPLDPEIDFVRVSSYGAGTSRSSDIRFTKDLESEIEGKHVLLIEDIVDTGHTMNLLLSTLKVRKPRSLAVCALIDKTGRREVACQVDFPGFTINEGFLVGYGLDYAERYRNLDGVYELVG
jgi:hypoxanthine phosphoribosyltransferase